MFNYREPAFQRAIDEVRKVSLTTPKVGSKSESVVFVNKIQAKSNQTILCIKVQQQCCSRIIPLPNVV